MVQLFRLSPREHPSPKSVLAKALGQGLGNFVGNYAANKALTEATESEEYKKGTLADRMQILQTKLAPYGGFGQQVFQRRLEIEEQKQQEEQNAILGRMMKGEKISDEDMAKMPPDIQAKKRQIDIAQERADAYAKKLDEAAAKAAAAAKKKEEEEAKEKQIDQELIDMIEEGVFEGKQPHEVWSEVYRRTKSAKHAKQASDMVRMEGRENRLSLATIRTAYDKELTTARNELKDAVLPEDKEPIQERIKHLQKQKQKDMQRFQKGERNFDLTMDLEAAGEPEAGIEPEAAAAEEKELTAEEKADPQIQKLNENFDPMKWNGKEKRDKRTGIVYYSNGVTWRKRS